MQRWPATKEITMATLTIRNVDAGVKERLRVRAAWHVRSGRDATPRTETCFA